MDFIYSQNTRTLLGCRVDEWLSCNRSSTGVSIKTRHIFQHQTIPAQRILFKHHQYSYKKRRSVQFSGVWLAHERSCKEKVMRAKATVGIWYWLTWRILQQLEELHTWVREQMGDLLCTFYCGIPYIVDIPVSVNMQGFPPPWVYRPSKVTRTLQLFTQPSNVIPSLQ